MMLSALMARRWVARLGVAVAAAWLGSRAMPPVRPAVVAAQHAGSDSATVRHATADVGRWVNVFDDTARASWQKPEQLVAALGVVPGQVIADIGAGTGYFNRYFARAVGDSGCVYAVEIEPALVAHMVERARREGTPQVRPVLATPDDPRLPVGLDLVFLCNTYHHIDGRIAYFTRLRAALAPGGRVAIVDFKPGDLPVGPRPDHKLAPAVVIAELTAAGYELLTELTLLPYQYALIVQPATVPPDR